MTSLNFVLRPSTKVGHYPGSLCLRLIHRRKVKTFTLSGCRLYSEEWNKQTQTIIYPSNDSGRSSYLEKVGLSIKQERKNIHNCIFSLQNQEHYTIEDILCLYKRKKDNGKLSTFTNYLAAELEHHGQERTARAYRTVSRGLIRFNKGKDIPLSRINSCLMKEFENYLKEKGRLPNTVSFYMRNLRAIYNKAIGAKRIFATQEENPFSRISTKVTKTMKRALSLDELRRLRELDFSKLLKQSHSLSQKTNLESLFRTWRYFFFRFHARGMCFIDMAYLRKKNIRGGVIKYCRKKTGCQIEISLTPELQWLINSFAKETINSPYVFPIIQNDSKSPRLWYESALRIQNSRLKNLANLCGIQKPLSTHVARHSWATIGKQQNIPLRVLSECLGHSSEKTTLIYLDLLNNEVLDHANEVVSSALCSSIKNRDEFVRI